MAAPAKLSESEITDRLQRLSVWRKDDSEITRTIEFKDFADAMAFVERVAARAEETGHHPDICIEKASRVRLTLTTHSAGGLTAHDFDMAEKIDQEVEAEVR